MITKPLLIRNISLSNNMEKKNNDFCSQTIVDKKFRTLIFLGQNISDYPNFGLNQFPNRIWDVFKGISDNSFKDS